VQPPKSRSSTTSSSLWSLNPAQCPQAQSQKCAGCYELGCPCSQSSVAEWLLAPPPAQHLQRPQMHGHRWPSPPPWRSPEPRPGPCAGQPRLAAAAGHSGQQDAVRGSPLSWTLSEARLTLQQDALRGSPRSWQASPVLARNGREGRARVGGMLRAACSRPLALLPGLGLAALERGPQHVRASACQRTCAHAPRGLRALVHRPRRHWALRRRPCERRARLTRKKKREALVDRNYPAAHPVWRSPRAGARSGAPSWAPALGTTSRSGECRFHC
jgi:hypothetical protein